MLRAVFLSIVVFLLFVPATAQEPARLVLVETLAMDVKRRTVADLTAEDFRLSVGGEQASIESFDLHCPVGAADDPQMLKRDDPAPTRIAPDTPRKIVLAVDYNSLAVPDRLTVLETIESMLFAGKPAAEEVMLVALADGLRVEQRFTKSPREIVTALSRMKHDVTLSARIFGDEAVGKSYFDDLATLMDLLETHDGAKVVVLFSTLLTNREPNESWFRDVATRAAAARTAIYPNWARGLQLGTTRHGAPTLQRLAEETGGRAPVATSDLSLQYRRAQRDLSCRYVLGVHLDDDAATTTQPLRVRVGRSGVILLYPKLVHRWTPEEQLRSRSRATFVEPEESGDPLVRVSAFPMRPTDREWDTLVTLHFPVWSGSEPTVFEVTANLVRGGRPLEQYQAPVTIPATASGRPGTRWVTLIGDSRLKPGSYDLEVTLSRQGDAEIVSSATRFEVPEVPKKGLFVSGPILARVVPDGLLIRADAIDTTLDAILGDENGFEPLVVHEIDGAGRFLAYWEACLAGTKNVPPEGSVVRRRFMTPEGIEAHTLPALPFEIEPKGSMRCVHALDEIAPRTLRPGEYKLEVSVEKPGGEVMAGGSVPLRIE